MITNLPLISLYSFFKRFKSFDSIIGYELMNEPFAGNIFEGDHLKFVPGIAGETNLVPFYDIVQKSIRKIDDNTIIFWEPVSMLNHDLGEASFIHINNLLIF